MELHKSQVAMARHAVSLAVRLMEEQLANARASQPDADFSGKEEDIQKAKDFLDQLVEEDDKPFPINPFTNFATIFQS